MIELEYLPLFLFLISLVAFLYASVGHGGASGYLATLALFSVAPATMKSSALILNVFVSGISFIQYYGEGHFNRKFFIPFGLASVPASYVGAMYPLSDGVYKKTLGVVVILSIIRFLGFGNSSTEQVKQVPILAALFTGMCIGLLSGMLGIGGGIILSPVILLFHWAGMKRTAATSALFILVNSISGLLALSMKGFQLDSQVYYWLIAAIVGGLLGSYLGAKKFNIISLKYLLAIVLTIAGLKLILS
jgi:hypothetical protein